MDQRLVCLFLFICLVYADASCSIDGVDCNKRSNIEIERAKYSKSAYTSDEEWFLKEDLDIADDFIATDPEKAVSLYDDILQKVYSTRAIYAKARAMSMMGERLSYESKIITAESFFEMVKNSTWPATIWSSAVIQGLAFSDDRGLKEFTVKILSEALLEQTERSLKYINANHLFSLLLEELYILKKYEEGLKVTEKALKHFKNDEILTFMKGIFLKRCDNKKEGNKLLRNLDIKNIRKASQYIKELGLACFEKGSHFDNDIYEIFKEASKLHIFPSYVQRPIEYNPRLEPIKIWDSEINAQITTHEEAFEKILLAKDDIAFEAIELSKNTSFFWKNLPDGHSKGSWSEYQLFGFGKKRFHHCEKAPKTCASFSGFTSATKFKKGTIKFVSVGPKSFLLPQCGPSNDIIRVYFPIKCPKKSGIEIGKSFHSEFSQYNKLMIIADHSFERKIWNYDDDESLIFLSFDIPHPDLSYEEIKKLKFDEVARGLFWF